MHTITISATSPVALGQPGIVCHDVRNPAQRNEVLVRKGSELSPDQVGALLERGIDELHLAVPDVRDVGEDDAAQRIAAALVGPGVACAAPHFGQVSFVSTSRGLLRVDSDVVDRINGYTDVLLLTAEPDRLVETGTTLGVVKCAPLFLGEDTVLAIEATRQTAVRVQQFDALRVALVAPRDRLRGGAFERAHAALGEALAWYGSTLDSVVGADARVEDMAAAYTRAVDDGAQLIMAAGAAATDPLDVVFEGLRRAGGDVLQIGIAAEPGTACWIGRLADRPVLGLASCELFGQPGALDLLLPRLHTGEALDSAMLRRLAVGGLLLGPSRIAPYHRRGGASD